MFKRAVIGFHVVDQDEASFGVLAGLVSPMLPQ